MRSIAIIDDFLGAEMAGELLDFAIANEAAFTASHVEDKDGRRVEETSRKSQVFRGDWSDWRTRFANAIADATPRLLEATGVSDWSPRHTQLELAAHRDGGFFLPHIDTHTADAGVRQVRVVSAVYYMHRSPRRFSGGELAIFDPFGKAQETVVEARHDRLVAFPSFLLHEVRPIAVTGNAFEHARFSVNCWLWRERG